LDNGSIRAEIDVCIEKAELRTGRLRFSVACGSWKGPGDVYKATEYDFWNGPRLDSGVVWTDTVRVHKGPQLVIGKWEHISIDVSSLIQKSYAAQSYLQAIYAVIEWDGNNTSALKFKNFKVYRTLKKG
ncbi:MAG: hypothetical protein NTZ09_10245, partial [Candidatus Hydrogenedentes bacterium]|nr:hypothetical protein [Candidatus Hydrogenedentota bacterium]